VYLVIIIVVNEYITKVIIMVKNVITYPWKNARCSIEGEDGSGNPSWDQKDISFEISFK
jgi:hypothetical protein